ncbi:MAG: protein kinase [Candidatus Bathyarchaeia archaeon]
MKTISAESLSKELNIDEKIIYKELLEVMEQIKKKEPKKHFLLEENQKVVVILDGEDIQFIRKGTDKLSFMDLAVHFNVDAKTMNWILTKLLEKHIIEVEVFNYYTEVKNKPSVKAWFEPQDILTGEETTLAIEINSPCEISEPKITIAEASSIEPTYTPPSPLKIKPGKLTLRYRIKAKKHGTHKIDVTLEGLIEGVQFGPEKVASAPLKVKALPPELVVKIREEKILAEYQQECTVVLTISNSGTGEAQNLEIKGFEKCPEFEIIGPIKIGNIPAAGTITYPINMKPNKSGEYKFEKLTLTYEDLDGNHFETTIPTFEVHVITPQPKVRVEIIAPETVRSKQEFSAIVRIFNSGEGDAKNISFEIPVDSRFILSGQVNCFIPKLEARAPPEELPFKLQAPEKGELQIKSFPVHFQDMEGNLIIEECQGKVTAICEVEELPIAEKTKWPFTKGTTVGQFKIIEELPKDGYFAKVYLAIDTLTKEKRAIKALKPQFITDLRRVEKFVDEARIAMNLKEVDGIVKVFGVHIEKYAGKEYPYIVMEYMSGGSLEDWLQPGKPMNFIQCLDVIRDISLTLMCIHQLDFAHFDIKPSNILYDKEKSRWKLSDFGSAKIAKGEISSEPGTREYMAPEAMEGKVSKKSDIYSLGLVFREMLTGDRKGDLRKIERLQVGGKTLDSELARKLIDLIQRMLSTPNERPSIQEVYNVIKWEKTGL